MKYALIMMLATVIGFTAKAQSTDTFHLYKPEANATAEIAKAVAEAKQQNKNVLLQIGGNWCIWCLRFNKLTTEDAQLDSALHHNFVVYHLNYSKENKNLNVLAQYQFPQRFGFPVFVILDKNGNRIHTQNSSYLEEGKGYNKEKILEFFNDWSPAAINPDSYKAKD